MNKERLILDTDSKGNLKGLPKFPPNKKVEAFFLIEINSGDTTLNY